MKIERILILFVLQCIFLPSSLYALPWLSTEGGQLDDKGKSTLNIDHDAFGYDDEMTDPSGAIYLGTRFYNSHGQFISEDSFVNETYDRYAFSGDDPVDRVDPLGTKEHKANDFGTFVNHMGGTFISSFLMGGVYLNQHGGLSTGKWYDIAMNTIVNLASFASGYREERSLLAHTLTKASALIGAAGTLNAGEQMLLAFLHHNLGSAAAIAGDAAGGALDGTFYSTAGEVMGGMERNYKYSKYLEQMNEIVQRVKKANTRFLALTQEEHLQVAKIYEKQTVKSDPEAVMPYTHTLNVWSYIYYHTHNFSPKYILFNKMIGPMESYSEAYTIRVLRKMTFLEYDRQLMHSIAASDIAYDTLDKGGGDIIPVVTSFVYHKQIIFNDLVYVIFSREDYRTDHFP